MKCTLINLVKSRYLLKINKTWQPWQSSLLCPCYLDLFGCYTEASFVCASYIVFKMNTGKYISPAEIQKNDICILQVF